MHTFADLAKALNQSTVYLSGLQSRFELPTFDGAGYSEAYLAFPDRGASPNALDHRRVPARSLAHQEMGEDALRVLNDYRKVHARISTDVKADVSRVRAAIAWAKRF